MKMILGRYSRERLVTRTSTQITRTRIQRQWRFSSTNRCTLTSLSYWGGGDMGVCQLR